MASTTIASITHAARRDTSTCSGSIQRCGIASEILRSRAITSVSGNTKAGRNAPATASRRPTETNDAVESSPSHANSATSRLGSTIENRWPLFGGSDELAMDVDHISPGRGAGGSPDPACG